MTPQVDLIANAEKLGSEAKKVVADLGLLELFSEVADPQLVGSVVYGLMYNRDIDIHAYVAEYDINKVAALLPRLAIKKSVQKVQFSNFREHRRDQFRKQSTLPHAYYVGMRTVQPSGEWKIDVWFARQEDVEEYTHPQLTKLSHEQRGTILSLKEAWSTGSSYRDEVMSVDIYRAVLESGIRTAEQFEQYVRESRGKFK